MRRRAGVLFPIFSLPGRYGIGCFSREAYHFVDFLSEAGQAYWQILPLGPTSYGDSPYQSFSTFAGNPYFIDLTALSGAGLLTKEDLDGAGLEGEPERIDYAKQYEARLPLLKKAYDEALSSGIEREQDYLTFCRKEEDWLKDYALYMAIKGEEGGKAFSSWEEPLRIRDKEALAAFEEAHEREVGFWSYIQYLFQKQWSRLKAYANEKGVGIIGDMPIYVAGDSADAWADPDLFQLDDKERPTGVAGCPPDDFALTGQLWGNPLYDWAYHKKTDYAWWKRRMKKAGDLYDVVRIDHFRGFDQYYAIPAGAENAVHGEWMDGPGLDLFKELTPVLKSSHTGIIAEDLGFITDSVRELVRDTGYPNMKVLEFAFGDPDGDDASEYLPCTYPKNCIAYTGTHDNETLVGWLRGQDKRTISYIRRYLHTGKKGPKKLARSMIRSLMASSADTVVIPLQDWLGLSNEARINTPSTTGGNWLWRLSGEEDLSPRLAEKILKMTRLYGRRHPFEI